MSKEIIKSDNQKFINNKIIYIIGFIFLVSIISLIIENNIRSTNVEKEAKLKLETLKEAIEPEYNFIIRILKGISSTETAKSTVSGNLEQDNDLIIPLLESAKNTFYEVDLIYLMNKDGLTVACTPYGENNENTLTGNNYAFRPYFSDVIKNETHSLYNALGVTTFERGFYIGYPIFDNDNDNVIGVAVAKLGLDNIDKVLEKNPISVLLSPEGVIFASSEPDWLFKIALNISPENYEYLLNSKQYANKVLVPLQYNLGNKHIRINGNEHSVFKKNIFIDDWQIAILLPKQKINLYLLFRSKLLLGIILGSIGIAIISFIKHRANIKRIIYQESILRKSENEKQIMLNNIDAGIVVINPDDHKIELANPKAAEMFGDSIENIVGKVCHNYLCPAQINKCPITDLKQKVDNAERVMICVDGTKKAVLKSVRKINIGNKEKLLETFIDITKQKEAESLLKNNNEMLEILINIASKYINISLENVNTAIQLSLKELGKFVGADRAYIFEYDWYFNVSNNTFEWCAENISSQIKELQNVPNELIPEWINTHRKGETMYIKDVGNLPENDETRKILEPQNIKTLITIPMMHGKICAGFVGFDYVNDFHDCSEKEKILLTVFAQMIINVNNRSSLEKELINAKQKAEDASKAKSNFLANMSHEIRTPLNSVIGFSNLLLKTNLDSVQSQYINNVYNSGNILLNLLNDILDFSKIEADMIELNPEKINIRDLCELTIDIIKFKAHTKGLEILLNISTAVPNFILGDSVRIRQVLLNLLSNAEKFTHSGEIELNISVQNISNEDKTVTLDFFVRDTGIGITKEQKPKLFKAFSQADSSTTKKYGGTGLGLVISSKLLKIMNSKLEFESEKDKGTKFYFSLTTKYYIEKIKDKEKEKENSLENIKKVLIIDDNINNRIILKEMLNNWNIGSDNFEDGISAIEQMKKSNNYDLVILDYNMPVLDGFETIEKMKKEINYKADKQPVILLCSSSSFDETLEKKCKEFSIKHKLIKPVKSNELFNSLKVINNKDDNSENENKTEIERKNKTNTNNENTYKINQKYLIMIAEDNKTNMMLAKVILSKIFVNSKIIEAENGEEAVELYKKELPNIIFMDIQMPVKDGYKASKEIRLYERTVKKQSLIFALTADIEKGQKEKCLKNGLNDFLSKPVIPDKIIELLKKWLKNPIDIRTISKEHLNNKKTETESKKVIHFDKVSLLNRLGGDNDLLEESIKVADKDIKNCIHNINSAYKNKEYDTLKKNVHTLKGAALTMNYNHLAELTIQLKELDTDDLKKISYYIDLIEKEYNYLKSIYS